jgi:hypothetical protein
MESKAKSSTALAFGLVLEGMVGVTIADGETRWVGPGEVFGMIQYELNRGNTPVLLTSTTRPVHYLAFSHEDVAMGGFARSGALST